MSIPSQKTWMLLLFILSIGAQYGYQESISKSAAGMPGKLMYSAGLMKTGDDPSYLNPPLNYLRHEVWKGTGNSPSAHYQRPPGYGLFLLPALKWAELKGQDYGTIIRYTQMLWNALVPVFVFLLLYCIFRKELIAFFFGMVALLPIFTSYSNYLLSEAVTPVLLLIFFFILLTRPKWPPLLGAILGILILVRPIFILLLGVTASVLFLKHRSLKFTVLLSFFALLPWTIWEVRNQYYNKPYVSIQQVFHPVYDPSNTTYWRLPHEGLYALVKLSNPDPVHFHQWHKTHWKKNINQDRIDTVQFMRDLLGVEITELMSSSEIERLVKTYLETWNEIPAWSSKGLFSPKELELSKELTMLAERYKSEHFWSAQISVPFKVLFDLLFHSHLNHPSFWKKDYNAFERFISVFCSCFFLSTFLLTFAAPWFIRIRKGNLPDSALSLIDVNALFILIYLFYLAWIQRGVEMRYVYPLLSLALLSSVVLLTHVFCRKPQI